MPTTQSKEVRSGTVIKLETLHSSWRQWLREVRQCQYTGVDYILTLISLALILTLSAILGRSDPDPHVYSLPEFSRNPPQTRMPYSPLPSNGRSLLDFLLCMIDIINTFSKFHQVLLRFNTTINFFRPPANFSNGPQCLLVLFSPTFPYLHRGEGVRVKLRAQVRILKSEQQSRDETWGIHDTNNCDAFYSNQSRDSEHSWYASN